MLQPGHDPDPNRHAELHADVDTIIERLLAANASLDAELDNALGSLPTQQVLQLASEAARRLEPTARQRATEQLAQRLSRLQVVPTSWDELRRPSLTQLQRSFRNRRLMRA